MTNPTAPAVQLIQSLPSVYKNCRYRSRLEARWAIFFDDLGIEFSYEMEGYKLPSGACYLPDFFLPKVNMFAEVKPVEFTPEENSKCRELMLSTGRNCLFLVQAPDFKAYRGTSWDCDEYTETDYLLDVDYHKRKHYEKGRLFGSVGPDHVGEYLFTEEYRGAVYNARSHRFEEAA